jgi:hypothetical protein
MLLQAMLRVATDVQVRMHAQIVHPSTSLACHHSGVTSYASILLTWHPPQTMLL